MRRRAEVVEIDSLAERLAVCRDGALTVREACRFVGLGRTTIYEMIAAGHLKAIRLRHRTLIPRNELVRLLAEHLGA